MSRARCCRLLGARSTSECEARQISDVNQRRRVPRGRVDRIRDATWCHPPEIDLNPTTSGDGIELN